MENATSKSRNYFKYMWVGLGVLVVFAVVFFALKPKPIPSEPLRVGYQNSPAMALIMVADAKGYFKDRHVNVELKEFTAGKFALQAFLGGSLDVAVAGDMPTGLALLQGQKFVAVGEVLKSSNAEVRMVVHQAGGCVGITPQSYFSAKKRKLATSFGGGPQYFTVKFFQSNKIDIKTVEIISQKPEEMPAAVKSGSVDGVAIFDPAASVAEQQLGADGCTFPDPGAYRQHYVIVSKENLVRPVADARMKQFIMALQDATTFVQAYPEDAQAIVAAKTTLPLTTVAQIWPRYEFGVVGSTDLKALWTEEAAWHRTQPTASSSLTTPDYDSVIDYSLVGK